MGVVDEADHRGAHRGDGRRERQVAEDPLQVFAGVCRGAVPAKSKYVHSGAEADHDGDQPNGEGSSLTGSRANPATTPVRVSPSTMMVSSPNRSMSACD
jgi:hypothetical protein